jgi:RepB plasmid partitioning protein/ParB-like nuclease domain
MTEPVRIAFQKVECTLPVAKIVPLHPIAPEYRQTTKYKLISSSIETLGIIEALVVYPKSPDEYLLLDGHSRLDALKELGVSEVRCTLSIDDEGYTYNKKVNHASNVAQHFMILKALENGVAEERLAEVLGLDVKSIRMRRDLLIGICPEAVHLLRNRKVAIGVFTVLRKMKPLRQVEASEHMIAGGTYSVAFARALLAVTRPESLVKPISKPRIGATSTAAQEMLGIETGRLVRDLKMIENSYGGDVLTLTVCSGFIKKLLANSQVENYLSRHHSELLEAVKEGIAD